MSVLVTIALIILVTLFGTAYWASHHTPPYVEPKDPLKWNPLDGDEDCCYPIRPSAKPKKE